MYGINAVEIIFYPITVRSSPGTPAYKSQEEYYEQILEYKKQVGALNQDASNMKAKIRRLEEDNLKKEKEIDSLLHPQKVISLCVHLR